MNNPDHSLVIRLSAMGDVAIAVPVLYAFAKAYPETKVTVLTKPFFIPILETIPGLHVTAVDVKNKHKGIIGLHRLAKSLKKENITATADLHNVLRSKIITYFLGNRVARMDKGRAEKKALTRSKNKTLIPLKPTWNRYVTVFNELGFDKINPEPLDRPDPLKNVSEFMGNNAKKWIGIAPFAAHKGKQYPAKLMEEVIGKLSTLDDVLLVLFGAPQEKALLNLWAQKHDSIHVAAGTLSFKEELNLISQLDVMLAMDSGNAHLAAMYGVPTVTLWGVTHPYAGFAPFGQENHCLLADRTQYPAIPTSVYGNKFPAGYESAMETIRPKTVVQRVCQLAQT